MSEKKIKKTTEFARRFQNGQKIFVVRPMKTAGTTLRDRLIKSLSHAEVYPAKVDKSPDTFRELISVSHLLKCWEKRQKTIKVVDGHFPLSTTKLFEQDFITIGLLRPPVQRTLSFLRHQKLWVSADKDKSLEEIYDDPVRFHGTVRNHMTRMFGMTWQQMYGNDGVWSHTKDNQRLLENAKAGLKSLDFIGLQPEFEIFWREFASAMDFDPSLSRILNKSPHEAAPPHLIERIKDDNKLDFKLYRYAQNLVRERRMAGKEA